MEIQVLKISNEDRRLLSDFIGEDTGNDMDFNRLMPVVEEIESMGYCARIVRSGGERCVIYDPEIHNSADVYSGKGIAASVNQEKKIDAVYKAVIEFIKFYNLQNHDSQNSA
jgi:hypothetical protein